MSTKRTVARGEAWRSWADHHAHGLCRPGFDAGFEAGVKWQADQERTLGELAKELAQTLEFGRKDVGLVVRALDRAHKAGL